MLSEKVGNSRYTKGIERMKIKEKQRHSFYIWEIALLIGLAVFLISGVAALQTGAELSDKVVRLHVLANSDSQEDQALKLQVRDAVLTHTEAVLDAVSDRKEAERLLRSALPELERLASEEIRGRGYQYPVSLELDSMEFPTRAYDGFTMPAGEYLALRVVIGAGEGQNWWCVVFPPLCTAAISDVSVTAAGLSQEEIALIAQEEGYLLKFKAVEFWETLRNMWREH